MTRKIIILTLLFFVIFSFCLSPFVSANFEFDFGSTHYTLQDFKHFDNFFIVENGDYIDIWSFENPESLFVYEDFSVQYPNRYSISFRGESYVYWVRTRNNSTSLNYLYDNTYSKGFASGFMGNFLYSTFDIYDLDGNLFHPNDSVTNPYIVNKEDVFTGNFKNLIINTGDFSIDDGFVLIVNELAPLKVDDLQTNYYPTVSKMLDLDNTFDGLKVGRVDGTNSIFTIPSSKLLVFKQFNQYEIILRQNGTDILTESFICPEISAEDNKQQEIDKNLQLQEEQQKLQEEQNKLQEEQNKTSKGIWDTIKEVLSYINPFSENFFVYKLLELLKDLLMSLFVPSEEFLNNWINEMNTWLSDRLGALYYPIDIVVDFLTRIGNISDSGTAVISGNGFEFMGAKVIPEFSYDLNSLLTNDTLKNIHSIYLTVVDVILYLYLVFLAKNTFTDIFGGQYESLDSAVEHGYTAYKGYKANKNNERKSNYIGFRK